MMRRGIENNIASLCWSCAYWIHRSYSMVCKLIPHIWKFAFPTGSIHYLANKLQSCFFGLAFGEHRRCVWVWTKWRNSISNSKQCCNWEHVTSILYSYCLFYINIYLSYHVMSKSLSWQSWTFNLQFIHYICSLMSMFLFILCDSR